MVCQWFGANGSRAVYYDMVPFISAALLHARTHTDDLWLIGKLYLRRTFWTDHLFTDRGLCERGTLRRQREKRREGRSHACKKKNCMQKKSRD